MGTIIELTSLHFSRHFIQAYFIIRIENKKLSNLYFYFARQITRITFVLHF